MHALRGELYAVVSQQRLTNFDDIVHNSLEAERGFDKAAREGSVAFDRKKGNLIDKCNALFIYLIILLENIVYYYIVYDFW